MSITEKEVKDKANALRNLVSFKNKTEVEIIEKARELLETEQYDIDVGIMFNERREIKQARLLLGKYLDDYYIKQYSSQHRLVYLYV